MRRNPSSHRNRRRPKPDESQTELSLAAMKEQIDSALAASLGTESGGCVQPAGGGRPQSGCLESVAPLPDALSIEAGPIAQLSSPEPPPLMPVRRLQNYAFCPRQFYFQWVEGVFLENADTVEGSALHRQTDKPSALPEDPRELELPEGARLRSLALESEELGLTGTFFVTFRGN